MARLIRCVLLVALLALAPRAPTVEASNEWCDTDPILLVHTPAGHLVPVYVNVGAQGVVFTPNSLLSALTMSYTASRASDGNGATQVSVVVVVPSLLLDPTFATRTTVSTGAFGTGAIYAQVVGVSGKAMTSTFRLPYS